jgi:hypothetical protein
VKIALRNYMGSVNDNCPPGKAGSACKEAKKEEKIMH